MKIITPVFTALFLLSIAVTVNAQVAPLTTATTSAATPATTPEDQAAIEKLSHIPLPLPKDAVSLNDTVVFRNPKIFVNTTGAIHVNRSISVQVEHLLHVLAALPPWAWPLGRAVQLEDDFGGPIPPLGDAAEEQVRRKLESAGIKIIYLNHITA